MSNYEIISDQHFNALKWSTFKTLFFISTILRRFFKQKQREWIGHFVAHKKLY